MGKYIALTGINYPAPGSGEVRREAGEIADDLATEVAAALLTCGAIAPVPEHVPAAPLPEPAAAYHAEGGKVFHTQVSCPTGDNIEPERRSAGDGGLRKCRECTRLERGPEAEE